MDALAALGPFSLAVIALGVTGAVALLVGVVAASKGQRVPAPLWLLPAALPVTVGLVGGWFELGLVLDATAQVGGSMAMGMTSAGSAIALTPALLGCLVGGGLALVAAWLVALAPLLRRDARSRWSTGHAMVPALLAVVGAPVLAQLARPAAALVALAGAAPCVLAALRCARREHRDLRLGLSLATARVTVATLATLGALTLAQAIRIHSARGFFEAVGMAASSSKQVLLASLTHLFYPPATILAALLVLAAGATIVAPILHGAWDRRAVVGAGLAVLLVLPGLGARTLLTQRLADVREVSRPWYEDRVEELATAGLELPRSSAQRTPEEMLTVSVAPAGIRVGSVLMPWDAEQQDGLHWPLFRVLDSHAVQQAELGYGAVAFRGMLRLEAHRELRWERMEPLLRTAAGARFGSVHVAVANADRELRVFVLDLEGKIHAEAGSSDPPAPSEAAADPALGRFVSMVIGRPSDLAPRIRLEALEGVWRLTAPGMETELATDTAQLTQAARRIKAEYPEDEDVLVVPVASTSWAELVAALDAVRGTGGVAEPLFPFPRLEVESPRGPDEPPGISSPP